MATQTELDDWADFALGSELLTFCNFVLDRTDEVCRADFDEASIEAQIVVVDRTISLLRSIFIYLSKNIYRG
jgi:hypothetical protein